MDQIEAKIEDLKQRAADRETMRYPEAFKEDATDVVRQLRDDGFTQQDVSELLEIPWVTLARWKDAHEEIEDTENSSGFRPVNVVDDSPDSDPVLVSPAGWRVVQTRRSRPDLPGMRRSARIDGGSRRRKRDDRCRRTNIHRQAGETSEVHLSMLRSHRSGTGSR